MESIQSSMSSLSLPLKVGKVLKGNVSSIGNTGVGSLVDNLTSSVNILDVLGIVCILGKLGSQVYYNSSSNRPGLFLVDQPFLSRLRLL